MVLHNYKFWYIIIVYKYTKDGKYYGKDISSSKDN